LNDHFEKKLKPSVPEWLVVSREMNACMNIRAESILSGTQASQPQSSRTADMDQTFSHEKSSFQAIWGNSVDPSLCLQSLRQFAILGGLSIGEIEQDVDLNEDVESQLDYEDECTAQIDIQ